MIEVKEQLIGQKLTDMSAKYINGQEQYIIYRFENGSYVEHRMCATISEHKLALLEKALDVCTQEYNNVLGGTYQPSTASYWVKQAEQAFKTPDKWALTAPIIYPEWLEKEV